MGGVAYRKGYIPADLQEVLSKRAMVGMGGEGWGVGKLGGN